jgi:hypothetical protein
VPAKQTVATLEPPLKQGNHRLGNSAEHSHAALLQLCNRTRPDATRMSPWIV